MSQGPGADPTAVEKRKGEGQIIPRQLYEPQLSSLLPSAVAARLALRALAGPAICQELIGAQASGVPSRCHPQRPQLSHGGATGTGIPNRGATGVQRMTGTGVPPVPGCSRPCKQPQISNGGPWFCNVGSPSTSQLHLLQTTACEGAPSGQSGPLRNLLTFVEVASCQTAGAQSAIQGAASRAAGEAGHTLPPIALAQFSTQQEQQQQQQQQHPHPHPSLHIDHVEQPPPDDALGFAEDASVHEDEEKLRPPPRLTAASIAKSLVAGGVAGGVSRTAVAPLERLKILQQVQNVHAGGNQYKGMWQGLKRIWQQEGFNGLFKGNGVNCARIVPNSAVKFFAYEEASHALLWAVRRESGDPDAELTPLLRLGAGATAGIIAMSATYPMDMVRGRLTVQGDGASRQYKNMVHAMATVWREEGPTALYRGWLPSVIGVVPYVGLNFAVYETLKDWLTKHYAREEALRVASLNAPGGPGAATGAAPVQAENVELSVVTKLACGAVAGTIGQTVAYPLDVVRRRLQMVGWKNAAPVLTAEGRVAAAPQYTGMVDAFRKTVQTEGVQALFRGLLPNSVKVVPSIAIAFVTYELMKDLLKVEIRISD